MIPRRRFLAVAAGAVGAVAAPRRARAQGRPLRGGVLKQIGLDPPTFDVHATTSHETQLLSSFVRRTLFKFVNGTRYGPSDFALAPDLALKEEASADGRTYTITLRPGVRWESRPPVNGRELVAGDVKYSIERALRKSTRRSSARWTGSTRPTRARCASTWRIPSPRSSTTWPSPGARSCLRRWRTGWVISSPPNP